ncbi:hypothetical protein B0H14DRAFT_3134719 [Mycena olivaceomarginata]|nr:hypothetical protein B0H14DRAFT_3134719 [Mycena olivaceomarginata]
MSLVKAKFLTESHCYVAFLNIHFQNPPILTSRLDCLTAKRLVPCSLCLARSNRTLDFPAPLSTPKFPALISSSPSKTRSGRSRNLKLTRGERETATLPFTKFRDSIRLEEHRKGKYLEHPRTMFLSLSIITSLLDNLLLIDSPADMEKLPLVQNWRHSSAHSTSLYRVLLKVQSKIRVRRQVDRDAKNEASRQKRAATKRMKRKAAELSDVTEEEGEDSEEDEEIEDFPAPNELRGRATRSRTAAQTRSKSLDLPTEPSLDAAAPNKRPRRAPALVDDAPLEERSVDDGGIW